MAQSQRSSIQTVSNQKTMKDERTIEQESWTISEIKQTLVYLFQEFAQAFKTFMSGVNNLERPEMARKKFLTSLSAYYVSCAPYFNQYLMRRKTGYTVQNYQDLFMHGHNYPNDVIYDMAMTLNNWNFQEGYFKLFQNKAQYATPVEEALAEIFDGEKQTFSSQSYNDLTPLYQFMETLVNEPQKGLKAKEDDIAYVITGDTGGGKSNLQLLLMEHHYKSILKVRNWNESYLDYLATDDITWINAIKNAKQKPLYNIGHDEAITILYRKEAMSTKNKETNILFNTIRGKQFVHSLLIPKFYRMDTEFVEDRMKFLLYVYKRGGSHYVAVYSYARMSKLLSEVKVLMTRKGYDAKTLSMSNISTPPNFKCKIPLYTGILAEPYKKRKQEGMDRRIDVAHERMGGGKSEVVKVRDVEKAEKMYEDYMKGRKKKYIYEKYGVDSGTGKKLLDSVIQKHKSSRDNDNNYH